MDALGVQGVHATGFGPTWYLWLCLQSRSSGAMKSNPINPDIVTGRLYHALTRFSVPHHVIAD